MNHRCGIVSPVSNKIAECNIKLFCYSILHRWSFEVLWFGIVLRENKRIFAEKNPDLLCETNQEFCKNYEAMQGSKQI